VLLLSAGAGSSAVVVSTADGLEIGESIVITGGGHSELHTIVSFGAMNRLQSGSGIVVVDPPLTDPMPAGSLVAPATPSPTPAPTPSAQGASGVASVPTSAPTPVMVSASGDPHMVNVHGQRFDILRPGIHVLLQLPRGMETDFLLRVEAQAVQLGGACADIYFQSLNLTGGWVRDAHGQHTRHSAIRYYANQPVGSHLHGTNWMSFGKVDLKVVWGHTKSGLRYLNMFARRLSKAGVPIGGLLGLDDHTAASTPSLRCKRTMTLLSLLETQP